MKKLIGFAAVIVVGFVLVIVLTNQATKEKLKDNPYDKENLDSTTVDLIGNKNYENIALPGEVQDKVETGDATFVYFFSPTCVFCQQMTPVLMPLASTNEVHVLQYNLLEYQQGLDDYKIEGTPTLIYFKDGKEVDRMVGLQPEENIQLFLDLTKK